ncbi:MAG: lasso peptide biosynthesis protein, partial [Pseudolabrys sp.]
MKLKTVRRAYLREAFVAIVLARLAVRFVPSAPIFRWADRPPRRINRFAVDQVSWVSWAVESVGTKSLMNALCLPRALAAHAMLRRRGIA